MNEKDIRSPSKKISHELSHQARLAGNLPEDSPARPSPKMEGAGESLAAFRFRK
jgi:hypothetical protein